MQDTQILDTVHHSLPAFRNTRQHFSTMLWWMAGVHFQQQNHQEKAEKCEKHGTKYTMNRPLTYSIELKQEGKTLSCST